jgi:hypothetical protein
VHRLRECLALMESLGDPRAGKIAALLRAVTSTSSPVEDDPAGRLDHNVVVHRKHPQARSPLTQQCAG